MLQKIKSRPPHQLMRLHLVTVLAAAAVATSALLFAFAAAANSSRSMTSNAQVAFVASDASSIIGRNLDMLENVQADFRNSKTMQDLPPSLRADVESELARPPGAEPTGNSDLTSIQVPLSNAQAVAVQHAIDTVRTTVQPAVAAQGTPRTPDFDFALSRLQASFEAYNVNPSLTNLRSVVNDTFTLSLITQDIAASATAEIAGSHSSLEADLRLSRYVVLAGLVLVFLFLGLSSRFILPLVKARFITSETEREAQVKTTESLAHRNSQLNALYTVLSEITDTLSVRYVVSTALREALKLIGATSAAIRLLRNDELVIAGSLQDTGEEVPGLTPVRVGEGLVGRVAKRGRTVRVDENAFMVMGQNVPVELRAQSAISVPLIVGARIVGILTCLSSKPFAFTVEDERVLEMMASQVATAVVAADSTETSKRQAMQDALTGLPNRRQLAQDLRESLAEISPKGGRAVIAMADIDHFKHLNDEYGHRVGDVTLQKVAAALRNSIRDQDKIYRYGGEEFVVILADTGASEALSLAERMRNAVATLPLTGDNLEPVGPVTISIGVSLLPEHSEDMEKLIDLADEAMYDAKTEGRNRVVLWRPVAGSDGVAIKSEAA